MKSITVKEFLLVLLVGEKHGHPVMTQFVVQFDGHLLDHGVQEIVDGNHFLVIDIRSIGFGDLELEFHVTLGQVDIVGGRFNVELNGTATLDS